MEDEYLRTFIRWAEETHARPVVTLNVRGSIVSGQVIAEAVYAEGVARQLYGIDTDAEKAYGAIDSWYDQREKGQQSEGFIHLEHARIMRGTDDPVSLLLWRGRLEAVDGFAIGDSETKYENLP